MEIMAFIESGKSYDKEGNQRRMKVRMSNMDCVQYNLHIPRAMHKNVKLKLAEQGMTMRSVLLEGLSVFLNKL